MKAVQGVVPIYHQSMLRVVILSSAHHYRVCLAGLERQEEVYFEDNLSYLNRWIPVDVCS
jgi:hypothetical protein